MRLFVSLAGCAVVLAQYVPEPYGWACFRMAAKRSWPPCASIHRTKQRDCLCQIPEFVVLTETCLQDAVANITGDQDSVKTTARRESLCNHVQSSRLKSDDGQFTLKKPLGYDGAPEMEYAEPIDPQEISVALLTAEWRMTNDRRATRAGVILIAFWAFVLLMRYVASIMMIITPDSWLHFMMTQKSVKKIQARFLNSPLGRQRHCQPCLGFLGIRLPTRMLSVIILLFAAANYALIFTDYPYEPDNFIYTSRTQQYNKSLAIRAAFMTMWKLPLLVCFAGRNNVFLLLRHPWPLDTFNVLHKWIGRITVVDIIIHSVAISLVKAEQGLYGVVWKVEYWQWGVSGTIITSLIAVQSLYWVRRHAYDAFVAIHVVLGVVFLISAWYHVYTLPYGKYHIVATCAIWGSDRLLRLARILAAGKVVANVRHHDTSVTIITVKAPGLYKRQMIYCSNSYVFLHIPYWCLFWQSHPFTIVKKGFKDCDVESNQSIDSAAFQPSGDRTVLTGVETCRYKLSDSTRKDFPQEQGSELMICVKHRRGLTKFLSRLSEGSLNIALDGPYGYSHPLHRFSSIVLIAGGIGITPVLSYVKRVLQLRPEGNDIQIHWAVTELASMRWAFKELAAASRNIVFTVYVSGQEQGSEVTNEYGRHATFIFRRLKCIDVVTSAVSSVNAAECELTHGTEASTSASECTYFKGTCKPRKHCSLAIFSCGPDTLNDDARVSACWAIEHATVYVDYYEESFSW